MSFAKGGATSSSASDTVQSIYDAQFLTINSSQTVPALYVTYPNQQNITLTQSLSMLQLLEDSYTERRLLPPVTDMRARTRAWDLATLIACDVQPLQNQRARVKVEEAGLMDGTDWARHWVQDGLARVDRLLRVHWKDEAKSDHRPATAPRYCVGDDLSVADVCLWPMVQGARRLGLASDDDQDFRAVAEVCRTLRDIPEFSKGGLQLDSIE
jgi:maleylacetoacetate isomerase